MYGVIGMLINQKSRGIYGFVMASVIAPLAPCLIGDASVHSLLLFTMSWCCHHAKSLQSAKARQQDVEEGVAGDWEVMSHLYLSLSHLYR